ncbi:hypothetical protein [Haladaptatus salinisoli]|uniref:hypothetical protein n=1 Tax=Haladaptatus salinisoli TaxID=2884876 RepID=UPI001D0BCD84|nr:hypothetical protein [Haladaptatus salinisoli]
MGRDATDREADRQFGPWALALGVLAVGTAALIREVRNRRGGKARDERTRNEDSKTGRR